MRIEILGSESLGVRGLSCVVEALRQQLYQEMPVPQGWHKAYARGITDTAAYRKWRDFGISGIV